VLGDLVTAHPDAVVADRDGPGSCVGTDPDPQLIALTRGQRGIGERREPEPVNGVGRIRDQLTEKDLLVAVQRVDHEVENLDDLGLETVAFPVGLSGHE
jgi:hypothetical protein